MKAPMCGIFIAALFARAGVCQNNIHPQSFPPVQSFDPSAQSVVDVRSGDVSAKAGASAEEVYVDIKSGNEASRVVLPVEMALVNKLLLISDHRLLVRGMVNGAGSEIAIIDINAARIVDKLLCYLPTVSPDGRYVAFAKFYPTHFAAQQSDQYMLYDTEKSPTSNTPTARGTRDWITAGTLVYPKGKADGDRAEGSPGPEHMNALAAFFWSPGGGEYVFLDKMPTSYDFVQVRILQNGETEVTTKPLQTARPCSHNVNARGETVPCNLLLGGVEFGERGEPLRARLQVSAMEAVTVDVPKECHDADPCWHLEDRPRANNLPYGRLLWFAARYRPEPDSGISSASCDCVPFGS